MDNAKFKNLRDDELFETDGGGIPVIGAIGIGVGVVMGISAIVSAYNGYQEAARGVR